MSISTPPAIRTRFAPSPTGFLHVGGIRTALFAYLLAKQAKGTFILRIEDTDKVREVVGSESHIVESLSRLGIMWDEGIDTTAELRGNVHYRQSERLDIYRAWAQRLIESGRAYADPYSSDEIQAFRDEAKANKKPFLYRDHRPENPPVWDGTMPLRFKSDPKTYQWNDAVMGDLHTGPEAIDDFILIKSDGYPTYNFAHIVDDAEMGITHVLRSQEFISSTPKFLNLYEALGVTRPVLATLPYVMAMDGKKKLSKRDGAKDVCEYLDEGYLPEAIINFLATLGWNDGTEQEVFTMDELIEKFSLGRVQKSPARFDEARLLWLNGQHIRRKPIDELELNIEIYWPAAARSSNGFTDSAYKRQVLTLVQDRLKTLADLPSLTSYFFEEPTPELELITGNKQLKKLSSDEQKQLLTTAHGALEKLEEWSAESVQEALNQLLETTGQKPGILFSLIRIATTWAPFSPQLNDTLALLGKRTTLQRLIQAITTVEILA